MLKKIGLLVLIVIMSSINAMGDHPGFLPTPREEFVEDYIAAVVAVSDDLTVPVLSQSLVSGYQNFYGTEKIEIKQKLEKLNRESPDKNYLMKNEIVESVIKNMKMSPKTKL